ncbi:MAG: META domain-containing protein [Solirubrobacterales bacterium]|nr:META domain-containing protein [Solirubrobacterales bacterium]
MAKTMNRGRVRASVAMGCILFVGCAVGVSGCSDAFEEGGEREEAATAELLDGRTYVAPDSYVSGRDLLPGTEVTISFSGSTLTATSGCRTFRADFDLDDAKLTSRDVVISGEPCSKEGSDQEAWLIQTLKGPSQAYLASAEAKVLSLGHKKVGLTLVSRDSSTASSGRLEEWEWKLGGISRTSAGGSSSFRNLREEASYDKRYPNADSLPNLSMSANGRFSFSNGCSASNGKFKSSEQEIEFQSDAGSVRGCGLYFARAASLLDGDVRYHFDGSDLVISDGDVSLRFFPG